MGRIYDYKSILLLKSKYEDTILMRKNQPTNSTNIVRNEKHIMVCGGTGCKASNVIQRIIPFTKSQIN